MGNSSIGSCVNNLNLTRFPFLTHFPFLISSHPPLCAANVLPLLEHASRRQRSFSSSLSLTGSFPSFSYPSFQFAHSPLLFISQARSSRGDT